MKSVNVVAIFSLILIACTAPKAVAQEAGGCPSTGAVVQDGALCLSTLTGASIGGALLIANEGACGGCFLAPNLVTCGACAVATGVTIGAMYAAGQFCAASAEDLASCHEEVETPSGGGGGGGFPEPEYTPFCTTGMITLREWDCNPTPTGVECRMIYHEIMHQVCL